MTEEELGAVEMVRADLSIQVVHGGTSYGPGKGILVPAGVAKAFAAGQMSVRKPAEDSRAAHAVPPAPDALPRARGTQKPAGRRRKV